MGSDSASVVALAPRGVDGTRDSGRALNPAGLWAVMREGSLDAGANTENGACCHLKAFVISSKPRRQSGTSFATPAFSFTVFLDWKPLQARTGTGPLARFAPTLLLC